MQQLPCALLAGTLIGSLAACGPHAFDADRELLEVTGATAMDSWHCEPEGKRGVRAAWRRGQDCLAEWRRANLRSTVRMHREADGRVWSISRMWAAPDSVVWSHLHDSVRTALEGHTSSARRCPNGLRSARDSAVLGVGALGAGRTIDLWRMPTYDLVLLTSPPPAGSTELPWTLQVEVARSGAIACGPRGRPAA